MRRLGYLMMRRLRLLVAEALTGYLLLSRLRLHVDEASQVAC